MAQDDVLTDPPMLMALQAQEHAPANLKAALGRADEAEHWRSACHEELSSLKYKQAYTVVD
jgi:hypothetical protein